VPDSPLSAADLAALLEGLRLRPQDVPSRAAANGAQLELAFARISALTELVRRRVSSDEATMRLAQRMLLADLGLVSASFRGEANEHAGALAGVLSDAAVIG
jgi:hypothetical protein